MAVIDSEHIQRVCSDSGLDCFWLATPLSSSFAQAYARRNFPYCMGRFIRATGDHRRSLNRLDHALLAWHKQTSSWLRACRLGHDDSEQKIFDLAAPSWTLKQGGNYVPRSALLALIVYDELACAIVPDACQPTRASLMADGEHLLKALVKVAQNR
ncbi:hypothetical protein [Burkholderia vietnamiensis]|uniref:hypothetical protein n=1 Tax=Burkholderia vietnamiensis TaxID=60552 RepID=UPI001594E0BE|nr:hypothetical protein [Burkholderia vietnamiensis]